MPQNKIQEISDIVFTIVLILLFVGCIVLFFVFAIVKQQYETSLYSSSGIASSAGLYIYWRKGKKPQPEG